VVVGEFIGFQKDITPGLGYIMEHEVVKLERIVNNLVLHKRGMEYGDKDMKKLVSG
jgi:hypothetical protein